MNHKIIISFLTTYISCLFISCNNNSKLKEAVDNSPNTTYAVTLSNKKNLVRMDSDISEFALVMKKKKLMVSFKLKKNTPEGNLFNIMVRTWETEDEDEIQVTALGKGEIQNGNAKTGKFEFDCIPINQLNYDYYKLHSSESSEYSYTSERGNASHVYMYMTRTDDFKAMADSIINSPQYKVLKQFIDTYPKDKYPH